MRVGVPREVKDHEYRVAHHPGRRPRAASRTATRSLVEKDAGAGSSIPDEEYVAAGATIVDSADDVWADAELLLKVKEPVAERVRPDARATRCCSPTCTWPRRGRAPTRCSPPGTTVGGVRDRAAARPLAAAARADVARSPAGWRPQVGAHCLERGSGGRGVLHGRRLRRLRRQGRRARRRRLRHERRRDRARHAGRGAAARQERRASCATPTGSTRATCRPSPPTPTRSSAPCSTPTSSSAPCSCRAPRRRR